MVQRDANLSYTGKKLLTDGVAWKDCPFICELRRANEALSSRLL